MIAVGAHIANTDPLTEAEESGADLVQMFLSNPQSWKKPNPRTDAEQLRNSGLPIYIHAPYLVNVVSDNNRVRIPSRKILQETCDAAETIGAAGVVVHGGHVRAQGQKQPPPDSSNRAHSVLIAAIPRWRKALEALDTTVPVLIENTAGGIWAMARHLEMIGKLWEEIGEFGTGFVLDTCHAWSAGEAMEGLVERALAATGRIDLVHANDSRDPFGSGADRHANLGQGQIPLEQLLAVIREAQADVVVETPGDAQAHRREFELIRTTLTE